MQPKHWTAFIILGGIWSASFLWIKLALDEIGPLNLYDLGEIFRDRMRATEPQVAAGVSRLIFLTVRDP